MKKKLFLTGLLALSMITLNAMLANAESPADVTIESGYSLNGWAGPYYSNTTNYGESVGVTLDDKRSGNASLCLKFPAGGANYANRPGRYIYYINDKASTVTLNAGTTYTIGVWAKGWEAKAKGSIWIGLDVTNNTYRAEINKTGETVDGWTKLYRDFTPSTGKTDTVKLVLDKICGAADAAGPSTAIFDDIFIIEKSTGVNLMADTGFGAYRTKALKVGDGKASFRISGWKEYSETATQTTDYYVMPVSGEGVVYSGNKAAYVYRKASVSDVGGNMYFRNDAGGSIPAGTYTISFYAKGTYTESGNYIGIRSYTANFSAHTKTYAGNGWYRYERTFTTAEDKDYIEYFLNKNAVNESYYIDGLSLVDSSGNEYATNGGFEEAFLYGECEPQRFVAYSASSTNPGKGVVAWKNPTRSDITNITLTVDGDSISFVPATGSGASNEVVLSDLVNKASYNCVLNITAGGKTYTYSRTLYQYDSSLYYNCAGDRMLTGGWTFRRQEKSGIYCDAVLNIDNEIKASGNSSVRVTCARSAKESDVYAGLIQGVTIAKNKSYQLSYKIRRIGSSGVRVIANIDGTWNSVADYSGRERWTEINYTINAQNALAGDDETSNLQVMFVFENGSDAVWIDDVALYEYEGGAATGENLIKNGGFEFDDEWVVTGYEYNLTGGGAVAHPEEGVITGSVNINNYSRENFSAVVITALYEDGRFVDASHTEQVSIPITVNPFSGTKIGGSVTVPEMDPEKTYKIKVFLWDSLDNCRWLTAPGVLE